MIFKTKNIVTLLMLGLFAWVVWSGYTFFFDKTVPEITVRGLDGDRALCNDVACSLLSSKKGEAAIILDGQPLIGKLKMSSKKYPYGFTIPTKNLSNGKHMLTITMVDSTYNKNSSTIEYTMHVDNMPLQAALLKSDTEYKVFQGRTLHVQFQANKEIKEARINALAGSYACFPESKNSLIYESFIPIPCEEKPNEYLLSVAIVDHVGNMMQLDTKFQVMAYQFKKQTLTVSAEKVKQEELLGLDMKLFEAAIEDLTKKSPREKLWKGPFCTPVDIVRVSCDFGTIRTTQHKGRYAHKALDVINQPKTAVWAPQDGIVVLKDRFTSGGNTVVIDHGLGVFSIFFHLDSFAKIDVGDKIAQGQLFGTLGKSGEATGYHLHWEMRVNNVAVDPMQWTKQLL